MRSLIEIVRALCDPAWRDPKNPTFDEKEWMIDGHYMSKKIKVDGRVYDPKRKK